MNETSYAEKIAQEAKVWGDSAEQETRITPPEWLYQRALRHNILTHRPHIDALLNLIRPGARVLELGCSTGWLTLAIAQRGATACGLDIADKAIDIARSYCARVKEEITGAATFEVVDLNTIDLPAECYDLVVAKGILHHLLNLENLVDQIHKTLKPGGLFWISDTNGEETLPVVLIAGALTFVLPTRVSYHDKIHGLLRFGIHAPSRMKASMESDGASPFEGAGRHCDWFKLVRERFTLEQHIDHPSFTGYVTGEVNLPDRLALPLLRTMSKLDHALVRCKILRSTGLTLYARKTTFPDQRNKPSAYAST